MQASRSTPLHTAWMNKKWIIGGTIQTISSAVTIVRMVLLVLENKLARSQPTTPVVAPGAGSASTGAART